MKNNIIFIILVLGIIGIHLLLLLNMKFTAWPEMLLWPYLWLHGVLPYKDAAIVHTPLLLMKLVVFYKLFGVGIFQLKVFTWLIVIFTDALLFFITQRLWGKKTALIALAVFVPWQIFFDGNGLWFDLLLAPLVLLTFYFAETKRYFWSGIFFGLMFFTKQTAVFFAIPILFSKIDYKKFIFGFLGLSLVWILGIWTLGIFPYFYNWAIKFGIFILPRSSGQIQLPDLRTLLIACLPFGIFLPLFFNKKILNINLALWAIAGSLGAYPRFEYFHFQPAVPFLAIATGIVFSEVKRVSLLKLLSQFIFWEVYFFLEIIS